MERDPRKEDQDIVGAAQGVVAQNLSMVEAGVDTAIQEAVHEVRSEAQQVVDRTLNRVKGTLEQQRPKIEEYMASHPWIVMGTLLLIGYLFAGTQRTRQR
jgi:ElaB/YqjD/DUF883 family membrane-anchored ribosome-binding protein